MNTQLNTLVMATGPVISLIATMAMAPAADAAAAGEAGAAGQAVSLPYRPPAAACTEMTAGPVYWVTLTEESEIDQTLELYPSGTPTITAAFDYNCVPKKTKLESVWSLDGEFYVSGSGSPRARTTAGTYTEYLYLKDGSALDDGAYGVEYYVGETLITSGTVTLGDGTSVDGVTEVTVQGTVTDARTKKPISGAVLAVLQEGVDPQQWMDSGTDADMLAFAKTDSKGRFELDNSVPVGTALPWLVGAKGYKLLIQTDFVIEEGVEDPYEMNITLERAK